MSHKKSRIKYHLNVSVNGSTYPIYITDKDQINYNGFFQDYPTVCIITSSTIFYHLYSKVFGRLKPSGFDMFHVIIGDGEKFKTLDTVRFIYSNLLSKGLSRDGLVVAFGGGVVGDVAGFAAATFMRGVDYVQVPTTLLAMVDSSIGGKTGVNLDQAKNAIGAFHQPRAVFCDMTFLDTLPTRQFMSGLVEVIKCALILDKDLYQFIVRKKKEIRNRDRRTIGYLIYRACQLKSKIVEEDQKENGLRQILNFGHTVGHAIESAAGYDLYLHGEAVALGILVVMGYLVEKGALDPGVREEFTELLGFFSLPTSVSFECQLNDVLDHIKHDKKKRDGKDQWVTLSSLGVAKWGEFIEMDKIRKHLVETQRNE